MARRKLLEASLEDTALDALADWLRPMLAAKGCNERITHATAQQLAEHALRHTLGVMGSALEQIGASTGTRARRDAADGILSPGRRTPAE